MVIKRDWYQTDERVTISFFVKQAKDVTVDFGENFVSVGGKTQGNIRIIKITGWDNVNNNTYDRERAVNFWNFVKFRGNLEI